MRSLSALLDRVLRRHPSVVFVVAAIPCAYFAACGAGDVLAARLTVPDASYRSRIASRAPSPTTAGHHVRDRDAIVRRNVFDSQARERATPGPVDAPPVRAPFGPPDACGGSPGATSPPCESTAKVVGLVMGDDPRWSFALVRPQPEREAVLARAGGLVDGRSVVAVSSCSSAGAWVVLRAPSGSHCYVAERMPPRARDASPAGVPTPEPAFAGIERTGERAYEVRRDTVERVLANPISVMRSVRVMPVEEGGRAAGVRLFGVAGSPLAALGLRHGDVVRRVNGLEMGAPDQMLEALMRLRTSDRLSVELTRGGEALTLDVAVR